MMRFALIGSNFIVDQFCARRACARAWLVNRLFAHTGVRGPMPKVGIPPGMQQPLEALAANPR